ncbi:hypothetical protein D8674_040187 [Pyrus ussuriensis x Pyrus communis]|uniref:Uncharacterized protein n=1 Tax=Pyrus ussuriensis x Pyrus communis TaxID=2448454 RepID=A0A5N5I3R6_9ROSA|nr:hypothetical protein D8674_040187 [Pyrus ussuriensis x Pyrus communis]
MTRRKDAIFVSWLALANSMKQFYGQPLHYLTHVLVKISRELAPWMQRSQWAALFILGELNLPFGMLKKSTGVALLTQIWLTSGFLTRGTMLLFMKLSPRLNRLHEI